MTDKELIEAMRVEGGAADPWWGDDRKAHMLLPARLVPASEADADPATSGPIGGGA